MIDAVVLDIEGTTSPTSSVREGLYGYTRQHLARWLADNQSGAAHSVLAGAREIAGRPDADINEIAGRPDADINEIAEVMCRWLDSDIKAEPLKTAQGLICAAGFRGGDLYGEFFDDVRPALTAWHADGISLSVFSSGSVRNQQDWFSYARGGEMASLISSWFDLTTAGPKREGTSYRRIADEIGLPGGNILFLSDQPDELDAAVSAGWSVVGVARAGEPNSPRPPHRWVDSFADVDPRAT
ncbi:acireductone synthase [Mycobacterium intermedium]|uniref:Acireductone synthase n=1 Tax=Mycobacterium intermedium TaxID=28445 RepID=A0A1E3SA25_MYCIE|nr:acireductone synthase [Mycobacterium intermedium]MCV6964246.1 acireductone synthase [Mycobacterium intermedium]ODQ99025.1 2,3-diketo-5-methylthio-1-phosphopentane phosphatase [Mycobacterium intermedium]OPE46413.1 acireductone synthase [Mycobacterium intermedium]ORB05310.1 acireductone synthase [Mycobacterium intermedium]